MFSKGGLEVDYEKMWKEMKTTYEMRISKLEEEGKTEGKAIRNAKMFINVMTHFELKQSTDTEVDSDGMDDYHFKRFKQGM